MQHHTMRLYDRPFTELLDGKKILEVRLLDEKRRTIKLGDSITFAHSDHPEKTITFKVKALFIYPSFYELFKDFNGPPYFAKSFTVDEGRDAMRLYYSIADEEKYGVLAIKLSPLMTTIFEKITTLLNKHNVKFEIKEHEATPTSEESAKARGEPLKIGAKALLLKIKDVFILAVIPANKRLDTRALRKIYDTKNIRFANEEELELVTKLPKGAVPPFSHLFNIEMIVDEELFNETYMAFNAGSLTTSIKMRTEDYKTIVQPEIEKISEY